MDFTFKVHLNDGGKSRLADWSPPSGWLGNVVHATNLQVPAGTWRPGTGTWRKHLRAWDRSPPPTLSLIRMTWRISRLEGELMFAFEPPEGWLVYCCRNTLETNKLTHTHRRKQSSWHILISISFLQFFFWIWSSCCNDALFQTLFRFVKWG